MVAPLLVAAAKYGIPAIGSFLGGQAQADAAREKAAADERIAAADREQNLFLSQQGLGQSQARLGLETETMNQKARMDMARREAFSEARGRGAELRETGEAEFMGTLDQPVSELEQAKEDMLSGQAEAMGEARGQMQAGLAQQGVRGGQAATQMRRGMGEMGVAGQRDINKMMAEDAMRRQATKGAYQERKALSGQQVSTTAPSF